MIFFMYVFLIFVLSFIYFLWEGHDHVKACGGRRRLALSLHHEGTGLGSKCLHPLSHLASSA